VPTAPDVVAEGARYVRIMCLSWGAIGISFAFTSVFRATGKMVMAMVITLLSQWTVQFPLVWFLSKHTGLHARGLWWSFPASTIAGAIFAAVPYFSGGWKKKRLTEEMKLTVKVTEEEIVEEGLR
jgi:Na+-driven multidrug efflux pump